MPAGWRDLSAVGDGVPFTIPGAELAVSLTVLHTDPVSRAVLNLVRFPRGWRRPGSGHYLAGEEFVVLAGSIRIGDRTFRRSDWVWLPPGAHREPTRSDTGALALAWFCGPARWREVAGRAGAGMTAPLEHCPGRPVVEGVPGSSALVRAPAQVAGVDRDLLRLADLSWTFAAAGTPLPPRTNGPAFERSWAASVPAD